MAESTLVKWFGAPKSAMQPSHLPPACGVDRITTWPGVTADFFQDRFVGYLFRQWGGMRVLHAPDGIRVGVSLAQSEQLGGAAFAWSDSQGGSWTLTTPSGELFGLLTAVPPNGSIENIGAGAQGCAGMTP
jgi:hypothetical protein